KISRSRQGARTTPAKRVATAGSRASAAPGAVGGAPCARRCSHFEAAANEQHRGRGVGDERHQHRCARDAECYYCYLNKDKPTEKGPHPLQLNSPRKLAKLY